MKNVSPRYPQTKEDKKIERMLKNWSKVRCARCGKVIDMLTADPLPDGRGFVCRGGSCA